MRFRVRRTGEGLRNVILNLNNDEYEFYRKNGENFCTREINNGAITGVDLNAATQGFSGLVRVSFVDGSSVLLNPY